MRVCVFVSAGKNVYPDCGGAQAVQSFASWLTQTVRLYAGQPFVEIEWIAGPVPIDDANVGACRRTSPSWSTDLARRWVCLMHSVSDAVACCAPQGKEVISRISTNISSAGYLYTDSNGREMQAWMQSCFVKRS